MLQTIKKHKIVSLIILLVIIGGGYYGYNKYKAANVKPTYVTAPVEKGTLIISVSSSGQVSTSNQVDIKAKVPGDITKIAVISGQEVKAGDLIAQIDITDAYKAVRDARSSLETAQLSYDKFMQPAIDSIQSSQNSVDSAQATLDKLKFSQPIDYQEAKDSLTNAQTNLDKAYSDTFNDISNAFLNLPNIVASLDDILNSDQISASEVSIGSGQINTDALLNSTFEADQSRIKSYQNIAESDYAAARKVYDIAYQEFKNASVYSAPQAIENLLSRTLTASLAIAQAIKSENNYLTVWSDARALRNWSIFSKVTTYKTNLATYAGQTNSVSSNLLSAQSTIKNDKNSITAAENNLKSLTQNQPLDLAAAEAALAERKSALADLKNGPDPLDIRSQELSLQQKRNSLYDAQAALADYAIKAPFDGMVGTVNVKVGDAASGAIITTLMTKQQIAEISLNEVDVAKIKVGNKATLTFDAIDELNISGQVAEIDAIGTATQGVVTYNVKIVFDTQDDRVKSGMSANSTIIIDSKVDVLLAPNAAVKTDAAGSYVQMLDATGQPQINPVVIGVSDDTMTEIIDGLNDGDKVITQTITTGAANATTGQSNGLRIPGMTGGSTGANRSSGGGMFIAH
ncbi:MAG: HlyD family efflux transporter periplasmic adaptor subunit [bacterium]|nr:HlyD family efflux transporter periplasmic adaptor subunit [bacterium]